MDIAHRYRDITKQIFLYILHIGIEILKKINTNVDIAPR
jgi:hypothetical protein